ncbi:TPA: hypothetical protein ACT9AQ_002975 [Legionella pneumophila]|nr:hypothetical protein [Legionella pneumophila]HDO8078969.1 hypothetical protein [Legionella pneumophila]HDO8153407.1 hypothetical protein [Legionella pneumophila]
MSKLNQIQNALKELDGGKFQKLCDCYLKKAGDNLNPIGSVFGTDKVRKGTPDTAKRNENGKFIFVEYTTKKNDLFGKLLEDIEKCLNEEKTNIKVSDIEEIILCFTGRLTLQEEQNLYQKTEKSGIVLTLYGIEGLSFDLYRYFPGLAKDFLGVNIDTGQILTPDDFVLNYGKKQYSTSLDTAFYFREKEIEQALFELDSNCLLLISGSAGVGKSRLALEIIHRFKQHNPEYEAFCIRDRGQDLFEDLKVYFSKPGSFLIVVDDANRIGKFDYITHLLQDCRQDQQIKVVATVRDYAIEKIRNTTQSIRDVSEISLAPFKKEELSELIKKLFNISNNIWLDRICEIASGNPRLAVMAAKIAIEEENLNSIRDVSSLYEQYFSSIRNDLQELDDLNVLKTAGIISLFRSIDKTNEQLMETIWKVFNIDANIFWQSAQILHEFELVDIYEKEVVKITDQVLATYLFYLCVFVNEAISLKIIFEDLFPNQINRISDAIYPCLNSFDYEQLAKKIRPVILEQWSIYRKNNDDSSLRQLIKTFWFLLQTETLTYVHEKVDLIEIGNLDLDTINWEKSNNCPDSNSLLPLLSHFSQADDNYLKMAIDIILQYTEKKPTIIPDVLRAFSEHFGFNRHSHLQNYSRQYILIDKLIECTKNGENLIYSKLFIALCKSFLHTQFEDTTSNRKGITIHQCKLLAVQPLLELRQKIWNHLFKLFNLAQLEPDVIGLLSSYCKAGYFMEVKEIAEYDCQQLISFLSTALNPQNFQHCLIVNHYIKFATKKELSLDVKELSERFNSKIYQIYELLSLNFSDCEDGMGLDEFEEFKRTQIAQYTHQYSFEDYKSLLSIGQEIFCQTKNNHEQHYLVSGLLEIFNTLACRNPDLYSDVITYYLSTGEPFKFHQPFLLIKKLIDTTGFENVLKLIEKLDFSTKTRWLFAFYQTLKSEQIQQEHIDKLYVLYEKAEPGDIPNGFDYLLNYLEKDNLIIVNITRILVNKASTNPYFGHSLNLLFNPHVEVNKQLIILFKSNETILKQAYLALECVDQHADYDGRTFNIIMNNNPDFLLEYIDHIYSDNKYPSRYDDSRDYSFLWQRGDIEKVMISAIEKILDYEIKRGFIFRGYLENFFCTRRQHNNSKQTKEKEDNLKQTQIKQDNCLKMIIEKNFHNVNMMSLVYGIIAYFEIERRIQLVAFFLTKNQNAEEFKILPLEPSMMTWSGSAVPMIADRITYLENLLPYCNSIKLLKQQQYIEERIRELQKYLEAEMKADFINN